ncbi:MAG: glutamate-5-semialdehyde dehydrogenase [Candidatus Dadabacteria bacterium]
MDKVDKLIVATHRSSYTLQSAANTKIQQVLRTVATEIVNRAPEIIKANQKDVARYDPNDPKIDRLLLNLHRIESISKAILQISKLPCPAGVLLEQKTLSNGIHLEKRSAPLGVVAAIYESRPNVTFDIAALCLRSKNACLLKGSKDAENTNKISVKIIQEALKNHDLPAACITLLPSGREVADKLFHATKYIDVIIPRGSAGLIEHVRKKSLVPTIETGAGVCHVFVDKKANLEKAVNIVVNAKVSRPSVCNALDTVLIDEKISAKFIDKVAPLLEKNGVEIYADPKAFKLLKGYPQLKKATKENYGTEYLSLKCAVKVVNGIEEALNHIREYSTKHSEAIVSENSKACKQFINQVDAAVVYTNASTRFTDGEEFGLGAEIGISTQKLHARGPFALEKLVTEKWIAQGNGQVRK